MKSNSVAKRAALKLSQVSCQSPGVPDEACCSPRRSTAWPDDGSDLPQNAFCGGDLVRPHHQQRVADVEHRVNAEAHEQRVLLEEGGREVLQVLDQRVVRFAQFMVKSKLFLVALRGVGK